MESQKEKVMVEMEIKKEAIVTMMMMIMKKTIQKN